MANTSEPTFPPGYLEQTRAPQIIFGSVFPAVFATIFVFARFYSRAVIMKNWGWDDTWILISWIGGSVILAVLNCYLTKLGAGKHIETVEFQNLVPLIQIGLSCRLIYQCTIYLVKVGMCAFYLRIFTDKLSKKIIWGMVAYNVLSCVPVAFSLIFRCDPLSANWSLTPGTCRNDTPPLIASMVLNIIGDLSLVAFAIPRILRLQIAPRQKVSLSIIMSLSILVIIAAIVRVVRVQRTAASPDVPWDSYDISIWTAVELNTSLFCASAPAIKPLLKQIAPGLMSTMTGSRSTNNRMSNYAHNTGLSRRTKPANAFELSSQTNLENKAEQGEYWTDVKGQQSSTSDGASDAEQWSQDSPTNKKEIRKTVKVTVSTDDQDGDARTVKKFEAV